MDAQTEPTAATESAPDAECPAGILILIAQLRTATADVRAATDAVHHAKGGKVGAAKKRLKAAEQDHTDALARLTEAVDLQIATICLDIIEEPVEADNGEGAAPSDADIYAEALKRALARDHEDEPAAPAVEYPHCDCGAVLALEAEQTQGKCEACQPIQAAEPPATETDVPIAGTNAPQDVPLPFPPPPVEPFDFQLAAVEMFKQNRIVESMKRVYDEAAESAKDAKKQWEAAAVRLGLLISDYDRRARESDEANRRRAELQRCYQEQLEAEAAKAGDDQAPAAPSTPEERVPDLAGTAEPARDYSETIPADAPAGPADAPTPLSDALPACACGAKLALDTEKARGTCDPCAGVDNPL